MQPVTLVADVEVFILRMPPFFGVDYGMVVQLHLELIGALLQFGDAGTGQVVHCCGLLWAGIGGVGDGEGVVDGFGGVGVVQHGGGHKNFLGGRSLLSNFFSNFFLSPF